MKSLLNRLKGITSVVDVHLDMHYRIGMRVIKTVASVMICLLISLLTDNTTSVSISAVAALVTLCATQGDTVRSGILRILGTLIGGVFGILTVVIGLYLPYYSNGMYVVVIPAMLLLNLYLCNLLNLQSTCQISCIITIIIAANVRLHESLGIALIFTLTRLMDTSIGVVVATIINILPHYVAVLFHIKKKGESL